MINLDNYTESIKSFLLKAINRFKIENKEYNSIGIYCCPWAGWITINFNINKTLNDTKNNCPDFDFVEYDFLDLSEWQNEYETYKPEFKINDSMNYHNHDLGDENLNQLIFSYLKPLAIELKQTHQTEILLQMLDSSFIEQM